MLYTLYDYIEIRGLEVEGGPPLTYLHHISVIYNGVLIGGPSFTYRHHIAVVYNGVLIEGPFTYRYYITVIYNGGLIEGPPFTILQLYLKAFRGSIFNGCLHDVSETQNKNS